MGRPTNNQVCAIITAYNSGHDIDRSLPAIAAQVKQVVIIDDCSRPDQFTILKETTSQFANATLIQNSENRGLAYTLNRAAHYAESHGFEWMITLDDNGKAESDMIEKMLGRYEALNEEEREKIAIIAPNYTTLKGPVHSEKKPFFVPTTITAGQLVKIAAWKKVGGYKEDLIIGAVDHDFSFKILAEGLKILLVPSALLEETPGPQPEIHSFLGKKFVVPHYSSRRYYYTYRNNIYLYKTYCHIAPRWIIRNIFGDFMSFAKIILFEPDKFKKSAAIARGIFDGIRGRLGKIE